MTMTAQTDLRFEERQALDRVEQLGTLSAQLYRQGDYSEADFILYGVLERLVIRRRLVYLGLTGDQKNATFNYGLPGTAERAPAAEVRVAA
jgi:hypothetical protein